MRKVILNLHLYTAFAAGLFLVILGLTGSIMAFDDDLDRLFNPALFKVQPQSQALSVTAIQAELHKAFPKQQAFSLRLPAHPDDSYMAFTGPTQTFINGYTGQILGSRSPLTIFNKIHQLHTRLWWGKVDPKYVRYGALVEAVSTMVLVFLIFSGIYLWWPLKIGRLKFGTSLRRFVFDLHSVTGIYFAFFLLVLASTGIAISYQAPFTALANRLTNSTPQAGVSKSTVVKNAKPISADNAIQIARDTMPEATPLYLFAPGNPTATYRVSMRFPEDRTPGGRSIVDIDQYSGKVISTQNSRTGPAGTRIVTANRAIHTGDIYGYVTKSLMSLSSLMLVVQVITGYFMWWKKLRPTQRVSPSQSISAAIA